MDKTNFQNVGKWMLSSRLGFTNLIVPAGNRLDVSAYQCVGVAARNRQNQLRPSSPLRPVVTRGLSDNIQVPFAFLLIMEGDVATSAVGTPLPGTLTVF